MTGFRAHKSAPAALLAMAIVWGATFPLTKGMLTRMPVADMLSVRFIICTLFLVAIAPKALKMDRRTLKGGLLLGAVMSAGQLMQTEGLNHVDASVSGFITGLYIIFTPLLIWVFFKRKIGRAMWLAVIMATIGTAVLSLGPSFTTSGFGLGEILTITSAAIYAAHIVLAGHFATPRNAMGLTIVQVSVVAIVCTLFALPGGITLPHTTPDWLGMLYLALIAGAIAFALQLWGQSHVEPTRAAVIMGTEPVWAATFAIAFGMDHLSWRLILGGLAIMLAIQLVIRPPGRRRGFGVRFGKRRQQSKPGGQFNPSVESPERVTTLTG